ncbi:MAG TPA: hypothetical protein DD671_09730, partial [Balneolaceae bacterium]|nr:hypothetical protein [Balneolaceae bacterium]
MQIPQDSFAENAGNNILRENNFQNLVRLAAFICDTDHAMINLLGDDGLSLKASFGLEESTGELAEGNPFCERAIQEDKYLLVEDVGSDDDFKPFILSEKSEQIRFYLGYNIKSEAGKNVGTISVLDTKPRTVCEKQIEALESLAQEVEQKLESLKSHNKLRERNLFLAGSSDLAFRINVEDWSIKDIQGKVKELTGFDAADTIGKNISWLIADQEFISALEELVQQEVNSSKQLETFLLQHLCFLDVRMLKEEEEIFVSA